MLFLISYALEGARFDTLDFGFSSEPGLLEALIPGFMAQVRRAFRRGLLQGYRAEETALPTVRGRIRFDDQLRDRLGVFPPAEVRYDDFTEDIELNRLIKAAIGRFGRMRVRSDRTRASLRAFDGLLGRVASVEYSPGQIPSFNFDRLTEHYEPATQLARLILRSTSIEFARGNVRAAAFLVDMNHVFEEFIVAALRDSLRLTEREFPRGATGRRLRLDRHGNVRLEPDISWWEGPRCVFVGDVKYKKTTDRRIPNADLYQLLAYTTATDLPTGLLIYAQGEDTSRIHEVVHADKRLEVVAVNLAGSPDDILAEVDSIADLIRAMRISARELGPAKTAP